jgi:2-amino-4-hydroxy-6-hydroxymethyldihydropteridine diphosphokinase
VIIVGIGSNLAAPGYATPLETGLAALDALAAPHLYPVAASPWYESAPVPASDQPWFANAVVLVETEREPEFVLDWLQTVEGQFGRVRGERNAARTLDLDIIDFDGLVLDTPRLTLPHPRMHERRFVLAPLCDLAPSWRHPRLGVTAAALLARLPAGQPVRRTGMT